MTAEICIMNRLAVVLAADSATTVSSWNGKGREERYFKGANKVFQLSNMEPIGLMIFDSADLLRVPWEIIIKSFRDFLGSKTFNAVEEYAREFFTYLNDNTRLFPAEVQNEIVLAAARISALSWIVDSTENVDEADQEERISARVDEVRATLDGLDLSDCIGNDIATKVIDELSGPLGAILIETAKAWDVRLPSDSKRLIETSLWEVMKRPEQNLSTTGLVFAGFGDHEIFPAMVEYESCGMVGGKHIFRMKQSDKIDHDTPASVRAFAQTSMTDTFALGLSIDAYSSLMVAVKEELANFLPEVAAASGGDFTKIADPITLVQATKDKISDAVLGRARQDHALPLRRVIGSLPVGEMAELAETLITLQSLKEKVTKPSETVGGPVDVAVITKHEGLVWIKRKHFFDSGINSRYSLRQAAKHQ